MDYLKLHIEDLTGISLDVITAGLAALVLILIIIMIINGVEIVGSASAIHVLTSPHEVNILNSGIIMATKGSIIARRRILIKVSFPLS